MALSAYRSALSQRVPCGGALRRLRYRVESRSTLLHAGASAKPLEQSLERRQALGRRTSRALDECQGSRETLQNGCSQRGLQCRTGLTDGRSLDQGHALEECSGPRPLVHLQQRRGKPGRLRLQRAHYLLGSRACNDVACTECASINGGSTVTILGYPQLGGLQHTH